MQIPERVQDAVCQLWRELKVRHACYMIRLQHGVGQLRTPLYGVVLLHDHAREGKALRLRRDRCLGREGEGRERRAQHVIRWHRHEARRNEAPYNSMRAHGASACNGSKLMLLELLASHSRGGARKSCGVKGACSGV